MPKHSIARRDAALKRLKITPAQLATAPEVSSIFRFAGIPLTEAIAAMRFSEHAAVRQFLATYDNVSLGDRPSLPFEAIVLKSGVDAHLLIGATMACFKTLQGSKSAMLAMKHHPSVLKSRIKYAKLPGGTRDRDALDTAVGWLPSPKGASINLNFGTPKAKESEDADEQDVNDLFPMITENQEQWQENRTKLLKAKD